MGSGRCSVPDAIQNLLQRASDYSDASEERCVSSREALRQATALIGMSRDAIARSRDQIARLETQTTERLNF